MRRRLLPGLAGLCLLLAVVPLRAADPKPIDPAFYLRIKPIEALVADARYLAELADKGDEFKQIEGIYKSMLKEKSLQGLDISRPLGAYGTIGEKGLDSKMVVVIPIADEKEFMDFLATKKDAIPFEKDKDGSYKVDVPNSPLGPLYFRFANKYLYATVGDKNTIAAASLLEPSKALPAKLQGAVAMSLDIDKVPDELKKVIIGQTANKLADLKDEKMPNETESQHKLREAMLDELSDWIKMLLNEGGEVMLNLDVDRSKGELSTSVSVGGKKGTKLAKTFTDLAAVQSVGAGLVGKDSAMNALLHVSLPERVRKAAAPAIDEFIQQALEQEKDKDKRAVAEKAFKVLGPTLKSGEVDLGMNFRGPSAKGQYTMVMALKVKDGAAIEKTLKDVVGTLPEKEKKNITFDIAKVGSIGIHKVENPEMDANAKEMFGDGPGYVAVRPDAVMMAIGDGALEALKAARTGKTAPSKALQFEMSMNRVLKMVPKDQQKVAAEAAKKAFEKDKDADKMTLALEAGPSLTLRFHMKAALVTFFGYIAEHQKKID